MKKDTPQKSKSFFENNSWYHRTKILQEDGTVKYGKKGGFATSKEADRSYDQYEAEFKKAYRAYQIAHQVNTEIMLKDYLLHWFEEVFSERVEATTRMVGAYVLYNLILPQLDYDIKLRYVNSDYLNSILEKAAKITASAGNKSREFLNMAFKEAVTGGYIRTNPVTETKPYKRQKPKIVVLGKEKIKVLLKAASKSSWYLEILLGLFCGLRKGEIMGLKFSDFDFEQNTVYINRQIVSNPKIGAKRSCLKRVGTALH
ncbi:site-specific integrase [Enterocloster bolteae]|uniref:site-specific integrase n=1 Tax=Enterocloster bolteae TaxID=208479 RepID=UPI0039A12181